MVLAAAGASTLFGLFLLPCATESLHRAPTEDGDDPTGVELTEKKAIMAEPAEDSAFVEPPLKGDDPV